MVRVTPLASAALLSLAAIEVVVAKSQQHFRDSSGFLDTHVIKLRRPPRTLLWCTILVSLLSRRLVRA